MTIVPRTCERCGGVVPAERVEALPDTRVCVGCSRAMGGEFDVYVVTEQTGKAGSLKKKYGGYATKKVRKPILPAE